MLTFDDDDNDDTLEFEPPNAIGTVVLCDDL